MPKVPKKPDDGGITPSPPPDVPTAPPAPPTPTQPPPTPPTPGKTPSNGDYAILKPIAVLSGQALQVVAVVQASGPEAALELWMAELWMAEQAVIEPGEYRVATGIIQRFQVSERVEHEVTPLPPQ